MEQEVEPGTGTVSSMFADRVAEEVDRKRSQLLVGLDPRPELLPVELRGDTHVSRAAAAGAVGRFCRGLVDSVAPYVVGVKLQLAFFEALGADGLRAFEDVCAYARHAGLIVVADGKRGDIGSTARAYADAYLEDREGGRAPVDALTANAYLGRRRRARVHERPGERARPGFPVGDLRLPRRRGRLADCRRRGGGASSRRGLGS